MTIRPGEGVALGVPVRTLAPAFPVERAILTIRGRKIVLDLELAALYGVTTKALNQAVKRNLDRFPQDFAFRLTPSEKDEVVTNCDHLGRLKFSRNPPRAFTEHGAITAATVLNSRRAVEASIFLVRAFVRLRADASARIEFSKRIDDLEAAVGTHDEAVRRLFETLRRLAVQSGTRRRIGFHAQK